jgi:hypothetical protein
MTASIELGRTSHKVVRNVGDGYIYTKYSFNQPETAAAVIGVAALVYYGGSAAIYALLGLLEKLARTGILLPA